ncbi:G-type lectin S-receptor-like serine/threonine-protein kinase At4g03230 [Malus domestica]|uniref:G-type lectin S-receptor-like serine/threonine-protein kinase At4g03230 n=1 Tax=Malus domestica TaxID=3750 RepID=UPI003976EE36
MLPAVTYLLSNFSNKCVVRNYPKIFSSPSKNSTIKNIEIPPRSEYNYTRLVISITGEIQFLTWIDYTKQWNLYWSAPRDNCSVFNACGNFGSCNDNNMPFLCKCLPGFKPQYLQQWNSGDFSGGCTRKSLLRGDNKNDTFLSLKKMKVGNPDSEINVDNETECRNVCLNSCRCMAYSHTISETNSHRMEAHAPTSLCRIWNVGDLNNLEEEYTNTGQDLYVRVALSDLESTVRDCKPCGTTIIPYPLSTRLGCGDPLYFRFKCNYFTGQVSFVGLNDALFRVISINSSTRRFFIQGFHTENVAHVRSAELFIVEENKSLLFLVLDQIRRRQFHSERRVKELIDTSEFKEEEGIDVPFFDLQTILDATDNFSNANKLGQGGYGPVYKDRHPRAHGSLLNDSLGVRWCKWQSIGGGDTHSPAATAIS